MQSVQFVLAILFNFGWIHVLESKPSFTEVRDLGSQGRNSSLNSSQPTPPQVSCISLVPSTGANNRNYPVSDPMGPTVIYPKGNSTSLNSNQNAPQVSAVRSSIPYFNPEGSNSGSPASRQRRQVGTGSSGAQASSTSTGTGTGVGYPMMGMRYPMLGMGIYPGYWG